MQRLCEARLTQGEIADALPDEAIDGEDGDAVASMLRELGVDIREHACARTAWTLDGHFAQDMSTLENPAILEQLNHSM